MHGHMNVKIDKIICAKLHVDILCI